MSTASNKPIERRLIIAAQKHIARHGLEGFEIQKIARDATTSPTQVYRYFRSKNGFIVTVFSTGWDHLEDKLYESLRGIYSEEADPRDTIRSIVSSVFDTAEEHIKAVSATVVLGYTVGSPLRDTMKTAQGFRRHERLVRQFAKTCKTQLSEEQIQVVVHILFGSQSHS